MSNFPYSDGGEWLQEHKIIVAFEIWTLDYYQ